MYIEYFYCKIVKATYIMTSITETFKTKYYAEVPL